MSNKIDHFLKEAVDNIRDDREITKELLEDVISCGIITDQQEKYLRSYYFDSMSYSEIARKNGISRQAVHDGVSRAIKRLEETLSSGELK